MLGNSIAGAGRDQPSEAFAGPRPIPGPARGGAKIEWLVSDEPVPYPTAIGFMENRVRAIADGEAPEAIWLLEHPPLYTAGTSARPADLIDPARFPVFATGRGGQYTYHGPGQRVGYVMLDLNRRGRDVRAFVCGLEAWLMAALARFNLKAERRAGRVGLWVDRGGRREDKIAAIGVRLRHWVTFHGFAINVDPCLEHFSGIVPCGIGAATEAADGPVATGVTSLVALGYPVTLEDVDLALIESFQL